MKLFEIANEYQNILDQTFDHETGEINQSAIESLELMATELKDKGIAVASYIKNLDAERKAIEDAKKAMAEREARLDKRVTYLTDYLRSNMERCNISEISCPYFVVKLKKCPVSVDVFDESAIPDDYKKVKEVVTVDKVKLREEIQAGVVIAGVQLKQNLRLEIR